MLLVASGCTALLCWPVKGKPFLGIAFFQTPAGASSASVKSVVQINGSLARAAIAQLLEKGQIRTVVKHSRQAIYTRATGQ